VVPRQLVTYIATFATQFLSLKCYHRQLFMFFVVLLKTNKWNEIIEYFCGVRSIGHTRTRNRVPVAVLWTSVLPERLEAVRYVIQIDCCRR